MEITISSVRAKRIALQMIQDRGFLIPLDEEWLLSPDVKDDEVLSYYRNKSHYQTLETEFRIALMKDTKGNVKLETGILLSPDEKFEDKKYEIMNIPRYFVVSIADGRESVNSLSGIYINEEGEKVILYFTHETSLKIKESSALSKFMMQFDLHHIILVSRNPPPSNSSDNLAANLPQYRGDDTSNIIPYVWEVFLEKELQFNPTKHDMVPIATRRILGNERKKLISSVGSKNFLPQWVNTDIIAKYHGYGLDDIIEVRRHVDFPGSIVTEELTYIRIVPEVVKKSKK